MPPKKTKPSGAAAASKANEGMQKSEQTNGQQSPKDKEQAKSAGNKRKQTKTDSEPNKAARRSARHTTKATASPEAVLKYLLSDDALQHCQPSVENETKNESAKANKSTLRLYTTHAAQLNPFEELVSAAILSRPISHRLGHRTIRTVLNDPYNFNSAKAVRDAGHEKVLQAVWDARTQHKDKTAQEIYDLANTILDEYADGDKTGESLAGLRKKAGQSVDKERSELEKVKGIGKTGLDIFFRRIQWQWDEAYPFVDDRTSDALKSLGLPSTAEALDSFVSKNGYGGDDKKKTFVIILERAVGASLEKTTDMILRHET